MVLRFIRVWLPAVVVASGFALMVWHGFDDNSLDGGAALIGAGLSIWLLNVLHRMGVAGEGDRHSEDEARAYFDKFGRWPDD